MRIRWTEVWSWGLIWIAAPVAGGVAVVPEAARSGSYGLRATVEPACEGEEAALVVGPIATPQRVEACKEVVVAAEVRAGGELVAVAGERVAFVDGFSVAAGGRLVAGTTGGWDPSYVVDETPKGESELYVRWYARFDEVGLAAGERMTVLRVRAAGMVRGWVRYEATPVGAGEVWVEVLGDDGEVRVGERVGVGGGWRRLELGWQVGAALGTAGSVDLQVGANPPRGVSDVSLASALVDALELGGLEVEGSGGWLDIDDFATAPWGPTDAVQQ